MGWMRMLLVLRRSCCHSVLLLLLMRIRRRRGSTTKARKLRLQMRRYWRKVHKLECGWGRRRGMGSASSSRRGGRGSRRCRCSEVMLRW